MQCIRNLPKLPGILNYYISRYQGLFIIVVENIIKLIIMQMRRETVIITFRHVNNVTLSSYTNIVLTNILVSYNKIIDCYKSFKMLAYGTCT